jgi:hypothetical protein
MKEENTGTRSELSFRTVVSDIHFWIPLLALSAGLFVLYMLH